MKLSTRNIAFAMTLGAMGMSTSAVATPALEYFFSYGSAHIAGLQTRNWPGISGPTDPTAVVNGRVNTSRLMIPKPGDMVGGIDGGFSLWVTVRNTGTTAITHRNGGNIFIGMNQDVGPARRFVGAAAQGPIPAAWPIQPSVQTVDRNDTRAWISDPATVRVTSGADITLSEVFDTAPSLRLSGVDLTGAVGTATSTRPAGIDHGFQSGVGVPMQFRVEAGETIRLFRVHLRNAGLGIGAIWGDDAGEYGLGLPVSIPTTGTASGRNSLGAAPTGVTQWTHSGQLLDLQAVPEPATLLALGAGLAAVAARRRRKN